MLIRHMKLLRRRYGWSLGVIAIALSYLPLLFIPNLAAVSVAAPLVVASIALCLLQRLTTQLWFAALVTTLLAGGLSHFTSPELAATTRWSLVAILFFGQLLSGGAQTLAVRGTWGALRAKQRLKSRIRRQTEALQEAIANQNVSQQTVKQYESDRRALLEHLPVHIVQKDLDGRFTFVTQSFCKLVNRSYADVIGRTDSDLFPPETSSKFMEDDRRVMQLGNVFDDVEQTQLPDGTHSYMQVRKAPLRDTDGSVLGVQGIFWDVTEEYASRKELQRIESLAHALIHAALDAVLIVDVDGRVLEANPASEKILGYTQDQIANHPPLGSIMHPTVEERGQRASDPVTERKLFERKVSVSTMLQSATGKRIEARLRRSDGAWFEAEISTHPLAIGKSEGWAMFIRDITQRKRAEQELRSAKELAERANAAKSEFVANVSHELRTPLTGIIGLHELLQRSELDGRQQNYLKLAQVSSGNLLNLIDDLLDFSKIEAGRIDIEQTPFSLIECIEEGTVSLAARAQLRGLELMLDLAPELPNLVIGDPHRIRQILLNLLGNAIKFTEKGDICVRASLCPAQPDPQSDRVRVEVLDSGIGVAAEHRELIFDAFRQADNSTTRRFGGTGLGLTICRDLVELMGGQIGVADPQNDEASNSSVKNLGSCFYFELPLGLPDSLPAMEREQTTQRPVSPTSPAAHAEVIVLVASPSSWRELLAKQVTQLGYELVVMLPEQFARRQPAHLFAAGNHSIVIADYRELICQDIGSFPVVVRWILLSPLANAQPTTTPSWLNYADVKWLSRPIRRGELLDALTRSPTEAYQPSEIQQTPARSVSLLLVEDSPVSQTVLSDMLESLGHRVTLASNGREAINYCQDQRFDLVLMDIQMPEVDGLAATKAIREHEGEQPKQLIFALTAHASNQDRLLCEQVGMNGFLVKPISLDALRAAVADATKEGSSAGREFVFNNGLDGENRIFQELDLQETAASAQYASGSTENNRTEVSRDRSEPLLTLDQPLQDAPDWPQLIVLMNGNEKLLRDVLQLLVAEVPKLSRSFSKAVDGGDSKGARRAIHTLKSNVRHVGLSRIGSWAEKLEYLARDEQWEPLQSLAPKVAELAEAVADWAEQMAAAHRI